MRCQVDVDLCDFRAQDVADYVASNDRIWELAVKEREAVLYRRNQGSLREAEAAEAAAVRDGLIRPRQAK
jgi:hypothetical protein